MYHRNTSTRKDLGLSGDTLVIKLLLNVLLKTSKSYECFIEWKDIGINNVYKKSLT